jgi:hypothetical protein
MPNSFRHPPKSLGPSSAHALHLNHASIDGRPIFQPYMFFDMKTILVDIYGEQQESVLLSFLNSLKYNYIIVPARKNIKLQREEILQRENDFESGKMKSEPWEEVRKRFLH